MTTTTLTSAATVRETVRHPIIDADGHFVELGPLLDDEMVAYLEEFGGAGLRDRFLAGRVAPTDTASNLAGRADPSVRAGVAGHAVVVGLADREHARPGHRRTSRRCSTSGSTRSASTSRSSTRR